MRGMGEPKELQAGGRHLSALSKTPKLARPPSRHRSTDRCILTAGGSSCGDLSKPVATGQALAGPLGGFMSELHSYTHEGRTIYQWEQSVGCVSFKIAVLAALSTFSGVLGLVGAIHRRAVDRTQRPPCAAAKPHRRQRRPRPCLPPASRSEVNIYIEVPAGVPAKQLAVVIKPQHLSVGIKELPPYLNVGAAGAAAARAQRACWACRRAPVLPCIDPRPAVPWPRCSTTWAAPSRPTSRSGR